MKVTKELIMKDLEKTPSKKLKVGDVLLAEDLNEWCAVDGNFYSGKWSESLAGFVGDRTIEAIEIIDGVEYFLVSGTIYVYIRAKGFRKFCKRLATKETLCEIKY